MRRRDLLATLLSVLSGTGVGSLLDEVVTTIGNVGERFEDDDSNSDADEPRTRTAVVDRVEDDTAVVVFEDGTGTRTVAASVLPAAAREEGMVLRVPQGDSLAIARVDRVATARRREIAGDRFDDLATRPSDANERSATGNRSAS